MSEMQAALAAGLEKAMTDARETVSTDEEWQDYQKRVAELVVGGAPAAAVGDPPAAPNYRKAMAAVDTDMINRPPHYASGKIECIDAMEAMLSREEFIGYLRGCSFKYRWRYRLKNGQVDLAKARWYEERLYKLEGV